MNWKIIAGALIIYGGAAEIYNIIKDHSAGITTGPLYPLILIFPAAFVWLGFYLIYKGRQKKKPF